MPHRLPRLISALLLTGAVGMAVAVNQSPAAEPTTVVARLDAQPSLPPVGSPSRAAVDGYLGAASCSAANCHGGNRFREGPDFNAYRTWVQQDKHAQAYDVLFNDKSRQIAKLLQLPAPAHEMKSCLNCHSLGSAFDKSPSAAQHSFVLADGVSCEACHGPAEKWIEPHRSADWKNATVWSEARKAETGFRDTKNLVTRGRLCADCHIGSPGRDVNHDLIAAGHPRLDFEFGAFHANMPSHWDRKKDKANSSNALEARIWAVGQLVSAESAVKLLETRAADKTAPWPEFSEYSCNACHHDLQSPSRRQELSPNQNRAALEWGTWHFSLLPKSVEFLAPKQQNATDKIGPLKALLQQRRPGREQAQAAARDLAKDLEVALQAVGSETFPPAKLHDLMLKLTSSSNIQSDQDWERSAQMYLALVAIRQGYFEALGQTATDPAVVPLERIRGELRFPAGYDTPQMFQKAQVDAIGVEIERIRQIIEQE